VEIGRIISRLIGSALALGSMTACASWSGGTDDPGECAELGLRSTRGLRGYAADVAAVPEGVWVLSVRPPSVTLTLFGDDRRQRVEVDTHVLFGRPGRLQLASDGRVLAVLSELEDGSSALATVEATGAFTVAEELDVHGALIAGSPGRFVVYDEWGLRFFEGGRVIGGHDEPPRDSRSLHDLQRRVIVPTASGYLQALAIERQSGARRVTVRRLDSEGRPLGDEVVLDESEPEFLVSDPDLHIVAAGDGAVVVYRGTDGLMVARVGADGRLAARPAQLGYHLRVDALVADDAAIWLAGSVSSRWAATSHDYRHIERLQMIRLDHEGRITALGRLRTATGSTFRPQILAVGPGRLLGIHHREAVGRLDSRRDHITSRWLAVRCR
jgi:hypothetical protein